MCVKKYSLPNGLMLLTAIEHKKHMTPLLIKVFIFSARLYNALKVFMVMHSETSIEHKKKNSKTVLVKKFECYEHHFDY
jgi:hypothetical protein